MKRWRYVPAVWLLLISLISPAHALMGKESRPYFEWCATATDLSCFESVTFKYAGQEITYTQPEKTNLIAGSNVFYIWTPPGFVGADGGNELRLEASYLMKGLHLNVGGTKNRPMDPLPAACKLDPTLPCVLLGTLPSDLWISVTLRTSNQYFSPGFASAVMFEPEVKQESINGGNRFTFSGFPMRMMGYLNLQGSTLEERVSAPSGDYVNQIWSVGYLSSDGDPMLKKCLAFGSMILYSNAENSMLPTWNSREATMEMRTRSSHFEPDGVTAFKGLYYARISDGMVKCLWNVDPQNAAGQASVSIVYDDGQPSLGTFSVTRKDGWLYVNGANFTYSSPTIKLKMKKVAASKSINCVKGKLVKKVTGAKPKCPVGYKQR